MVINPHYQDSFPISQLRGTSISWYYSISESSIFLQLIPATCKPQEPCANKTYHLPFRKFKPVTRKKMEALLGATLTSKTGEVTTSSIVSEGGVVALYFSAHWCPPCRGFTPKVTTVLAVIGCSLLPESLVSTIPWIHTQGT